VTNDIQDEAKFLEHYLSAGGLAYATSVPLFLGRGNHDIRGKLARKLPEYINGPEGEYFYTFRAGPVGAIVMDTGEDKPDDMPVYGGLNAFAEYRSRQRAWLQKAIENADFKNAKYKIAFLHIPLVWENAVPEDWWKVWNGHKGWICEDGKGKWEELLATAGIQLIISGHTHSWAWFAPNEKRKWAQLVGGGPKPEAATTISNRRATKVRRVTRAYPLLPAITIISQRKRVPLQVPTLAQGQRHTASLAMARTGRFVPPGASAPAHEARNDRHPAGG
jgi:hypothetical protein